MYTAEQFFHIHIVFALGALCTCEVRCSFPNSKHVRVFALVMKCETFTISILNSAPCVLLCLGQVVEYSVRSRRT